MEDNSLPDNVKVLDFASSRLKEIMTVSAAMETKVGPKRVYQTLPRNLRRRAMSYNVKRLPRRLREQHKQELEKQGRKPPTKRPSRKFRRRPQRLLEEYTKRKSKITWLETHIWHAKRFKMRELWGYKIPIQSCCKIKRQVYRAVAKKCVIQDFSYYNCIELRGKQKILLENLAKMTSPECGETFKSQNAIEGDREGKTFLFSTNSYPYGGLGPVNFIWKPMESNEINDESHRVLWIWLHPSIHHDVMNEFISIFQLNKIESKPKRKWSDDVDVNENETAKQKKIKFSKGSKEVSSPLSSTSSHDPHIMKPLGQTTIYPGPDVVLTDLKDTLVRLRLLGPQSTTVLSSVLQTVKPLDAASELKSSNWNEICKNSSLTELAPRSILGFCARDPRLFSPVKKQLPKPPTSQGPALVNLPQEMSSSHLWNKELRDEVTRNKLSDDEINKIRSQCLVPGSALDLGAKEPQIPVILIQNPGNRNKDGGAANFGAGWDLILPSGWAMPFWISLIYNTALPAGLDSTRFICDAQSVPFFPYDFPDTVAGTKMMQLDRDEMMEHDLKRPPAKRVNYEALKIASPYEFPWVQLINNFYDSDGNCGGEKNFFVLRKRQELKKLDEILVKKQSIQQIDLRLPNHCLIYVKLRPVARGIVDRLSIICLPTKDDLTLYKKKMYSEVKETPKEKTKVVESSRKKFERCRKERRVIRRKMRSTDDAEKIKELEERLSKLQPELQLPDYTQNTDIAGSCSRHVIGFVTSSEFMLSTGEVTALGYCVGAGIEKLLSLEKRVVVLRKKTSLNYMFATLNIVYGV